MIRSLQVGLQAILSLTVLSDRLPDSLYFGTTFLQDFTWFCSVIYVIR